LFFFVVFVVFVFVFVFVFGLVLRHHRLGRRDRELPDRPVISADE